jgi:hypothetical protein
VNIDNVKEMTYVLPNKTVREAGPLSLAPDMDYVEGAKLLPSPSGKPNNILPLLKYPINLNSRDCIKGEKKGKPWRIGKVALIPKNKVTETLESYIKCTIPYS